MNLPNITKLAAWPELSANGWRPIRFRHAALGVRTGTGAALQRIEGTTLDGRPFVRELATVETPRYRRVYDSATDTTKIVGEWMVVVWTGPMDGTHYVAGRKLAAFMRKVADSVKG